MRFLGVAATLAVASALNSCGVVLPPTDRVSVAASFYPLAWVTEQVSGGEVGNLTTPGAEPHDLEPSINQAVTVADADLVVYEHGLQPALDELIGDVAEGTSLDVTTVVDLNGEDPHFWLDPLLIAEVGDAVAEELGRIDPEHNADYAERAAELRVRLEQLDEDYRSGLAGCARSTVVVSHDAFGYLSRYGLVFESIAGLSPGAEPSPGDLARLDALVRREGITTVFAETLASPRLAQVLADEAGVRTAVLDPIEGVTAGSAGSDYLEIMSANLAQLRKANSCPPR